jgi:hypothetical protein
MRPRASLVAASRIVSLVLILAVQTAPVGAVRSCPYAPVDPGPGGVRSGVQVFDFGESDDKTKSTAWQGPITISGPGEAKCVVDSSVSIVERPIFSDGHHLMVSTYSGSNRVVFVVDVATCQILWRSRPFTGPVSLDGDAIHIGNRTARLGPDCVP